MKKRYLWIGVATFVAFALVYAPAAIVTGQLERMNGVSSTATSGTLWAGTTTLIGAGQNLGTLDWSLAPTELLRGRLGVDVTLTGTTHSIEGRITSSLSDTAGALGGRVSALAFDHLLRRYDIALPGEFNFSDLHARLPHGQRLPQLNGEIHWSGGHVRWRMSGQIHAHELPPLVAFVDSATGTPEMTVYQIDDDTPLLLLTVEPTGWATVGVTKRFTELIGQPWSGNQPSHGVVVEVQEKLF